MRCWFGWCVWWFHFHRVLCRSTASGTSLSCEISSCSLQSNAMWNRPMQILRKCEAVFVLLKHCLCLFHECATTVKSMYLCIQETIKYLFILSYLYRVLQLVTDCNTIFLAYEFLQILRYMGLCNGLDKLSAPFRRIPWLYSATLYSPA